MSCSTDRYGAGRLTIDLAALARNFQALAARVAPATPAAVVKADAYRLGAARVSATLAAAGCRRFFVAHLSEACSLRATLPADCEIYVLNGLPPGAEADWPDRGVAPVINSLAQARRWAALAHQSGGPRPAALQLDSGMSRLGLSAAEVDALAADRELLDQIDLRLVMSHLACGDAPDTTSSEEQRALFAALADRLPDAPRSLGNSAGSFLPAPFHLDVVRPGLALYGAEPLAFPGLALEPVVRLSTRVIQLRDVPVGARVGYGYTFTAREPMRLATLGIGYADGWPRSLSNRGAAWLGATRLPIVGRVSMDSTIVDATAAATLQEGDEVDLIGAHQSLDEVAQAAGTITHDILTGLGPRLERTYAGAVS